MVLFQYLNHSKNDALPPYNALENNIFLFLETIQKIIYMYNVYYMEKIKAKIFNEDKKFKMITFMRKGILNFSTNKG